MSEKQTTVKRYPVSAGARDAAMLQDIRILRAAIWRAMMEIENDGAKAAYETLQYAWENSQ